MPHSEEQPLITLSLVSHGDTKRIQELLESLQKYERIELFQIIITDNLENDFPKGNKKESSHLTILRNKKSMGFAHNHNQAFQIATGKYFCVLNPDILFIETVFPLLIKQLEAKNAILAPLIVDAENTPQDSFREFPSPLKLFKRKLPGYHFNPLTPDASGIIQPDWIAGMFMLMRSETYAQLGGFDEKFHLYFEDVDICARTRVLGLFPLVDTKLRIQHNAQRASRKNFRYLIWHIQSAIRFFRSEVYKKIKKR